MSDFFKAVIKAYGVPKQKIDIYKSEVWKEIKSPSDFFKPEIQKKLNWIIKNNEECES